MASSLVLLAAQARALDELLPCRRQNAQLWFSDLAAELQLAKAYCQPCPLRRACLAGAVERHEPHGVWGGEIFAGGAIITEKRPPGRPPRTAGQAQSELTAHRSALPHQAELPGEGDDLGAVGSAEAAQNVADVLLHGVVKCTLTSRRAQIAVIGTAEIIQAPPKCRASASRSLVLRVVNVDVEADSRGDGRVYIGDRVSLRRPIHPFPTCLAADVCATTAGT